jgi:purine-binding chemotaxis protein CheW
MGNDETDARGGADSSQPDAEVALPADGPIAFAPASPTIVAGRADEERTAVPAPASGATVVAGSPMSGPLALLPEADAPPEPEPEPAPEAPPAPTSPALDDVIAAIDGELDWTFNDVTGARLPALVRRADHEHEVIFSLDDTAYCVAISNVAEIGVPPPITPLPNVPAWVLGVANLRGDIVSVVDLRAFLGLAPPESRRSARMMVAHTRDDDMMVGLVVDSVQHIRTIVGERFEAPSAPIEGQVASYLRGVCEHDGRLLVALDLERMLTSPEMRLFDTPVAR